MVRIKRYAITVERRPDSTWSLKRPLSVRTPSAGLLLPLRSEKDLGFLRIGSLNVRVKRTTEAFSQFLGVATSSASSNHEKIHKTWGSADNVQVDQKVMPPPKYAPIKKRRSRRAQDFSASRDHQVASQPSTPLLQGKVSRSSNSIHRRPTSTTAVNSNTTPRTQPNNDSDSDTACGFDSAWRGSAQL
ncbi:uncharacterized protein LOC143305243 isoform X3 [Osmia lignaria lignaria]|uniref:uncharacterized protein LOC143305243 isoform X3 n=1 Tax=Osmia lignaria lignaria TaxID=1437193 RepID=UPI00402B4FBC